MNCLLTSSPLLPFTASLLRWLCIFLSAEGDVDAEGGARLGGDQFVLNGHNGGLRIIGVSLDVNRFQANAWFPFSQGFRDAVFNQPARRHSAGLEQKPPEAAAEFR